jgi:hypothetical protein
MAILPSREYLLECFDYDKDTDTLTWRKRPAEHFESANAYRHFLTFIGRKITNKRVTISGRGYCVTKIIFKIIHGFEPKHHTDQKGGVHKENGSFIGRITIERKVLSKSVKFEKKQLPIVIHKKVSKAGFHGVTITRYGKFQSSALFNYRKVHLGVFETAKEASDAYQIAKQQIKDGVFVPSKKTENKNGFVGVIKRGRRFAASYKSKRIGTFDTAEEAHAAYLKAKNHKTFDDGLDILQKLAQQYG